jgi:hypothetical protein
MGPFDVILTIIILLIVAIVWLIKRVRKNEREGLSLGKRPPKIGGSLIGLGISGYLVFRLLLGLTRGESSLMLTSGLLVLIGGWASYRFFRRLQRAFHFRQHAVETPAKRVEISKRFATPEYTEGKTIWLLLYTYLDGYKGSRDVSWRSRRLSKALDESRLHVFVDYLPADPEVHRVSRIEVGEPKQVSKQRRITSASGNLGRIEQALLDLSDGPGDRFVVFTDQATGRFVQFANTGLGALALDLPVMELDEGELERARAFFRDRDTEGPIQVTRGIESAIMHFDSDTTEIRYAAETTMGIFTQVFGVEPNFDLDISTGSFA